MINLNEKNISVETKHYNTTRNKMSAYSDLRICYVKSGYAEWNIQGIVHHITAGDIVLLSDKQKRMLSSVCSDGICICSIKIKRQAFLNTSYLTYFLNLTKAKKSVIKDDALLKILETIEKEYNEKNHNHMEMLSAKLTEFFVTIQRKIKLENCNYIKIDKNMIKVLDFIDNNITEKITLSHMAKLANMAESSFSRLFSQVNGINFKKYVMTKKVEYAILLLENTDKNVIDIAYECGFSSISGFYDAFKKVTGTTPNKISGLI